MKRTFVTSAAACGLCLGVVAPLAVGPAAAAGFPDLGTGATVSDTVPTAGTDVLDRFVPGANDDTLVVIVPGTDDIMTPRIDGLVTGRQTAVVNYPESFWPIISGKSGKLLPFLAPTYDNSRTIATDNTLAVMEALKNSDQVIVYTGYSQGSDALGNAAEQAAELLGPNDTILLVSDPRSPWGIKSQLDRSVIGNPLARLIGVKNDGARDPAATGDAKVVHVIIQGDPVAHTQWKPLRPVSSLIVNAAGFLTIHSGTGAYTYAHLEKLDHVRTLRSEDGNSNSTYEIYDTYHPLALLNAMIFDAVGIPYSEQDLERWDRAAETFYATEEITAENGDPKVRVTEAPLSEVPAEVSSAAQVPPSLQIAAVDDAAEPEEYQGRHRLQGTEEALTVGKHRQRSVHAAPEAESTDDTGTDDTGADDTGADDTGADDTDTVEAPVLENPVDDAPADDAPAADAPVVDDAA